MIFKEPKRAAKAIELIYNALHGSPLYALLSSPSDLLTFACRAAQYLGDASRAAADEELERRESTGNSSGFILRFPESSTDGGVVWGINVAVSLPLPAKRLDNELEQAFLLVTAEEKRGCAFFVNHTSGLHFDLKFLADEIKKLQPSSDSKKKFEVGRSFHSQLTRVSRMRRKSFDGLAPTAPALTPFHKQSACATIVALSTCCFAKFDASLLRFLMSSRSGLVKTAHLALIWPRSLNVCAARLSKCLRFPKRLRSAFDHLLLFVRLTRCEGLAMHALRGRSE